MHKIKLKNGKWVKQNGDPLNHDELETIINDLEVEYILGRQVTCVPGSGSFPLLTLGELCNQYWGRA